MWKVSKWIFLVTTVPLLAVGIGFLIFGFMASPEALTDDGYSLKNFFYSMGGAFIFFPLLTTLGVILYYKRINDREIYLIQNGIEAEAEILEREQTGTFINEQPEVKFILLMNVPGEEPYQVEHKEIVNLLDMASIPVGKKIPVKVDPNNSNNFLLIL